MLFEPLLLIHDPLTFCGGSSPVAIPSCWRAMLLVSDEGGSRLNMHRYKIYS